MPLWAAAVIGGLIEVAGTLVGKVLLSLGMGYIAFSGVDTSLTWARDFLLTKLGALPAAAINVAGTMQVGTAISILTSALATRLLLQGLTSGTLRRMVVKS